VSIIKRTDVNNHLSARRRTEIHLEPTHQADATGFSGDEQAEAALRKNDKSERGEIAPVKSV